MYVPKSIDGIKERIREIEAELAKDARYQELGILRDTEAKLAAIDARSSRPRKIGGGLERRIPTRKGKQPEGKVSQHEAAEAAVRATGYPLTTAELVRALPTHGAKPSAMNPEVNLTSIISKRGNLKSIRWRGKRAWWPKDLELPT